MFSRKPPLEFWPASRNLPNNLAALRRNGELHGVAVRVCDTFWTRSRGLLGWTPPPPAANACSGALLVPCRRIHTAWMSASIDVYDLDKRGVVLAIHENVRPWRLPTPAASTFAILELAPGSGRGICTGDALAFSPLAQEIDPNAANGTRITP